MREVAIVIPYYKRELSKYEYISICQCFNVLNNYDIYFISYKELVNSNFRSSFPSSYNFEVACFDSNYFSSLGGYNRLLLSEKFYQYFSSYKYILIYQSDAYVFSDQLLDWCAKGYDYIGAPWFKNFRGTPKDGLWKVGNGGLSLRNVKSHINLINSLEKFYSAQEIILARVSASIGFENTKSNIINLLGKDNSISNYIRSVQQNEDVVITDSGRRSKTFYIPTAEESISFSFDRNPEYLFEANGEKLPFGCHAWYRDDEVYKGNLEFWRSYIL